MVLGANFVWLAAVVFAWLPLLCSVLQRVPVCVTYMGWNHLLGDGAGVLHHSGEL